MGEDFQIESNKLHLCCGSVYLTGYLNVDIQGKIIGKDIEYEDVDKTTFENYYKYPLNDNPINIRGKFSIDKSYNLLEKWPWKDNSIQEIVLIQAVEHFLPSEIEFMMCEIYRVLNSGGSFVFDFPDIVKTVMLYSETNFKQMNRLLYCNHKDQYSVHKCAYNQTTFTDLLNMNNRRWSKIKYKEVVKHDYPVIGGISTK